MLTTIAFVAVRKNPDGKEWLDTSTLDLLPDLAREHARATDRLIPDWANAQPVLRVVKVTVMETEIITHVRAA